MSVIDATYVFDAKKDYDKQRKRKKKNRQYHDELKLQIAQGSIRTAIDAIRYNANGSKQATD
jgi:hypothetical protein